MCLGKYSLNGIRYIVMIDILPMREVVEMAKYRRLLIICRLNLKLFFIRIENIVFGKSVQFSLPSL